MIIEQKYRPRSQFLRDCLNENTMSLFEHLILFEPSFNFSDINDILDPDEWKEASKNKDIYILYDIAEIEQLSELPSYLSGKLNVNYQGHPGKYILRVKFHQNFDYLKKIYDYSAQDLDVGFVDINKNVYLYTDDDITAKGIPTELVNVEKIIIGDDSTKYTTIYIILNDASEFMTGGIVEKIDFKFPSTKVYNVTIEEESFVSPNQTFKVVDSQFGFPVEGLPASAFSYDDEGGAITFSSVTDLGGGYYSINGISPALTNGNILIDDGVYFGSGAYLYAAQSVYIDGFYAYSSYDIEFNVRLSSDDSLVSGLLVGDFSIADDIEGSVTINTFSEVSTGRYRLSDLSNSLTSGDITISNVDYTGTYEYTIILGVDVIDIYSETAADLGFTVQDTEGDPIETLTSSDVTITDDEHGVLSINTFSNLGSGEYQVTLNDPRTSGTIAIDDGLRTGSNTYDFTAYTVKNGGGTGATDFVDTDGDGLADNFMASPSYLVTPSIVVGAVGGADRAQRVLFTYNSPSATFRFYIYYFKQGQDYKLQFRQFSSHAMNVQVISNDLSIYFTDTFAQDSFWPVRQTQTFNAGSGVASILVSVTPYGTYTTSYITMDEIELIEV